MNPDKECPSIYQNMGLIGEVTFKKVSSQIGIF